MIRQESCPSSLEKKKSKKKSGFYIHWDPIQIQRNLETDPDQGEKIESDALHLDNYIFAWFDLYVAGWPARAVSRLSAERSPPSRWRSSRSWRATSPLSCRRRSSSSRSLWSTPWEEGSTTSWSRSHNFQFQDFHMVYKSCRECIRRPFPRGKSVLP